MAQKALFLVDKGFVDYKNVLYGTNKKWFF